MAADRASHNESLYTETVVTSLQGQRRKNLTEDSQLLCSTIMPCKTEARITFIEKLRALRPDDSIQVRKIYKRNGKSNLINKTGAGEKGFVSLQGKVTEAAREGRRRRRGSQLLPS